jgi:DNA mismatch repair ATPase MutS
MGFLRSSKLQKQIQEIHSWNAYENYQPIFQYTTKAHIADSIWEDIQIRKWLETIYHLPSELEFGEKVFQHPLIDIPKLQERQEGIHFFTDKTRLVLSKEKETVLQWFLHSPELHKNYLYRVLFPSSWYMKWSYLSPEIFTAYHYYRCYLSPLSSMMYPISVVLGPYWFLKKTLKLHVSIKQYLKMVKSLFQMIRTAPVSEKEWGRFMFVFVAYVSVYFYSLAQLIDLSYQLHLFRKELLHKIKELYKIQQDVYTKYKRYKYPFWKAYEPEIQTEDLFFSFRPTMLWVHKILTQEKYQKKIKNLHRVCTIHDFLLKLSKLQYQGWKLVHYGERTFLGNMKNPMLPMTQVGNPILLDKHLIISGPNAGGKTTYIKSLLWNILLGQSFGIIYSSYGQIKIYDAFLHHHRVKDITHDQSLFQAEMNKIKETLDITDRYHSSIYFMDEPLHSTHPVDGASLLASLLEYLGPHEKLRILVTSHYFSIQELEKELPKYYHNLCVKAKIEADRIFFDYQLYRGGSEQTVGIELLEKEGFPEKIFSHAAQIKNKIYSQKLNV